MIAMKNQFNSSEKLCVFIQKLGERCSPQAPLSIDSGWKFINDILSITFSNNN